MFTRFTEYIDTNILKAKDQPAKSAQFSNLQNETQFGVAKPAGHDHAGHDHSAHDHVHDIEHENKQMFSCGSLAPKLKRGGGCMDHGFARAMEPWELSDGCVYLIKELTMVRCPDDAEIEKRVYKMFEKHATNLADLGFIDHFKHASSLKEQLFKSMFVISSADGLGKKKFRGFVELFLDPAFRNTKHQNQNCAVAAQDFIANLSKVFGENIAKAIVENHDRRYLDEYHVIKQQLSGSQGPGMQDFVYPPPEHQAFPSGMPLAAVPGRLGGSPVPGGPMETAGFPGAFPPPQHN